MKVNWDDDIPNLWKNMKCSKPPTREVIHNESLKIPETSLLLGFPSHVTSELLDSALSARISGRLVVEALKTMVVPIWKTHSKAMKHDATMRF